MLNFDRIRLSFALAHAVSFLEEKYNQKSIGQIVNQYRDQLYNIVYNCFRSGDSVDMRRAHKALLRDMAGKVYDEGLREGGISPEDMDAEDRDARNEAVSDWTAEQASFVNQFAKDTAEARLDSDKRTAILARVPLWVDSLRNFGEAGKLAALGNIALTFDGDDGAESCDTCQRYTGQRHRRKWWADRGLLERNGNPNYECGRWDNCHHHFKDDSGKVIVT